MKTAINILIFTFSMFAQAEEHKVMQLGKSFVPSLEDAKISSLKNEKGKFKKSAVRKIVLKEIKIKKNDTINFVNKDNVEHNVFGKGFDYHQKQGSESKHKFTDVGTRTIRCAIHPKMKLKVIVE